MAIPMHKIFWSLMTINTSSKLRGNSIMSPHHFVSCCSWMRSIILQFQWFWCFIDVSPVAYMHKHQNWLNRHQNYENQRNINRNHEQEINEMAKYCFRYFTEMLTPAGDHDGSKPLRVWHKSPVSLR